MSESEERGLEAANFIENIIKADLESGKNDGRLVTRFPPEPSGYLHIGHAKAICLNFGLAEAHNGARCHLRFDDTNPTKEESEYIDSIKEDITWLGYEWGEHLYHASDYFDRLYAFAVELIEKGKAYVCDLDGEQMREFRGTLTQPGKNSPYRERSISENLELFAQMKAGAFADGTHVLRARIDMSSSNISLRDPIIYRIRHMTHPMTGDTWCIYPMYDFTHCLSDAIEQITHSLCTLEFENHRPLYEWFLNQLDVPGQPRQIEFARLELSYNITSKRRLRTLVEQNVVSGWDDPRMLTIRGMRRRGITAQAVRAFCKRIGVAKKLSVIDMSLLEEAVRDDLNTSASRVMGVLDPLEVVLTNYDEAKEEWFSVANHPQNEAMGTRQIPFGREIFIEREDFLEEPPKKFFRLAPGKEVRLRYGYVIRCDDWEKDESGKVCRLLCSVDFATLGKKPEGRKVKGVIHWVSKHHAIDGRVRLYDRLFAHPSPMSLEREGGGFQEGLNPSSFHELTDVKLEPSLLSAQPEQRFQFERLGYFCADQVDHCTEKPCFNKVVGLRDTWATKV